MVVNKLSLSFVVTICLIVSNCHRATFLLCHPNMASHQILQVPTVGRVFPENSLMLSPDWLMETAEVTDRLDPLGDNVPTERLRGQLANNEFSGEVCFLGRSHPFMCATHYQGLCPPLPQTRLSLFPCACVYFTKNLFISCSDPILPELERIQLGI